MTFKLGKMMAEFHAKHAPCISGPCQCICGCTTMIGCSGGYFLCSVCHVRNIRGDDDEHCLPEDRPDANPLNCAG